MDLYGVKNFKRVRTGATIACAIIAALFVMLISFVFVRAYEADFAHSKSMYERVEYGAAVDNANTYYLLRTTGYRNINVKSGAKQDNIEHPHVFMQCENGRYFGNYLDGMKKAGTIYSKDECAVSADFAKKAGVDIGGKLTIHIYSTGEDCVVTVKKILPEYYGYADTSIFSPDGAIVLGYNPAALQLEKTYRVLSFVGSDGVGTSEKAPIYKNDLLDGIYGFYYLAAGLSLAVVVIAATILELVITVFFGDDERQDAAYFYEMTGSKRKKLIYIVVYSLYKYAAAYALSAALCLFTLFFGYKTFLCALAFNAALLIVNTAISVVINYFNAKPE